MRVVKIEYIMIEFFPPKYDAQVLNIDTYYCIHNRYILDSLYFYIGSIRNIDKYNY